jgi:shikimate kinase
MGAGKTTFGKKLAKALQLPFYDSDQLIEEQTQKTIANLFLEFGENGFRQLEKDLIQQLKTRQDNFVLSVGGGLPCFNNLMNDLNELGTTVYLKHSIGVLSNRLKNAKKVRPILPKKDDPSFNNFIEDKLNEREHFYLNAHIILPTNEQSVEILCSKLKNSDS